MPDTEYLCYFPNPYDIEHGPKLFMLSGGKTRRVDPSSLTKGRTQMIVSYEVGELLNYLAPGMTRVKATFVDVTHAYRLLLGEQYVGDKGKEPWSIWSIMRQQEGASTFLQDVWRVVYTQAKPKAGVKLENLADQFLRCLERVWTALQASLKERGEWERYSKIEQPVNAIFLKQQLRGIKINGNILSRKMVEIDKRLADATKALRFRWNLLDPNDDLSIKITLRKFGYPMLSEITERSTYDSFLEFYGRTDELPRTLRTYRNGYREKNLLLRLAAKSKERVFPEYRTHGTVTGRIIVQNPNIQNIKSATRSIFEPDHGKVLLYPDYSQFEPGIMADDSGDEDLLRDFNSGDLYLSLSQNLFGTDSDRRYAKIIFLAFCYGMKTNRMIRLASEGSKRPRRDIEKSIKEFFGRYHKLQKWKDALAMELTNRGRIGTRLGCYRYRVSSGRISLSEEERRWIISQRIQGTAALILKRVILRLSQELPDVEILLPMHDALLLQVPHREAKRLKLAVRGAFAKEFKLECPKIRPRITFDSFAKEALT